MKALFRISATLDWGERKKNKTRGGGTERRRQTRFLISVSIQGEKRGERKTEGQDRGKILKERVPIDYFDTKKGGKKEGKHSDGEQKKKELGRR